MKPIAKLLSGLVLVSLAASLPPGCSLPPGGIDPYDIVEEINDHE